MEGRDIQEKTVKPSTIDQTRISFRDQIELAARQPIAVNELLEFLYTEGREHPNSVRITDLTSETIQQRIEELKNEMRRLQSEKVIQFTQEIEEELFGKEDKEGLFDHELAHAREAQIRGVDLAKCTFAVIFIKSDKGTYPAIAFDPPLDIDPVSYAYIALAPQQPSGPDFETFISLLLNNKDIFKSKDLDYNELSRIFSKKTQESLDGILGQISN